MKHLSGISFALDVLMAQGFIALSWMTPWPWHVDAFVAIVVCFATVLTPEPKEPQ